MFIVKKLPLLLFIASLMITGCNTVRPTTVDRREPVLATADSSRGKMKVGEMKAGRVLLSVAVEKKTDESVKLAKSVSDKLVAEGFYMSQKPKNHYAKIVLGCELDPFDRLGNFYLYKGTTSFRVIKKGGAVISRSTDMTIKGERKLSKQEARKSTVKKLADELSSKVVDSIAKDMKNLSASEVHFEYDYLEEAFGSNVSKLQKNLKKVAAMVEKKPGVEVCDFQSIDLNKAVFLIVYDQTKYPAGVVHSLIPTEPFLPHLKRGSEAEDFVKKFFY